MYSQGRVVYEEEKKNMRAFRRARDRIDVRDVTYFAKLNEHRELSIGPKYYLICPPECAEIKGDDIICASSSEMFIECDIKKTAISVYIFRAVLPYATRISRHNYDLVRLERCLMSNRIN